MRLRRLELFGFKSFADRTSLAFENSLTGIVGPNGCGKSNVVDAIRWVLGETRPTSMRGGEMSDVIFKGSVSRPPMSVAEVTMVLDNSGAGIASRGAEVSITRRVFRSGEGEYLIDGEKVRLKDLRDMLYDTGLGSRGYSVLEQGRIDAVLSQNPLDRRAIFEEAAGISRYRQRRRETETRLLRVQDDVVRLDDVLKELGTRVRSLKIQAGKAERFVAARDEWRAERGRFLKHRLREQRDALSTVKFAIDDLEQRAERLRRLRSDEESDVAAREREQISLGAEVDRLAAEVARLSGEGRACDERHAQLQARIANWRTAGADESQRALSMASQLEVREAELESVRAESSASESAHAQAVVDAQTRAAGTREAREANRGLRAQCERQNELVLGLLNERTAAQNSVRHMEQAQPALLERSARQAQRLDETRHTVAALRAEGQESEQQLGAAQGALTQVEGHHAALLAGLAELERHAAELRALRAQREIERARLQSRVDTLRDLEAERASLESGARALLEGVRGQDGPCSASELSGVVADHLRTSTELARALDAALGPAALGVVTADPSLASRIIAWLGAKRAGQVRLFVPAGLARKPSARVVPSALAPLARLVDRVECTRGFEELAQWLVGDVLVAESVEQALELVAEHPEWRFVTADGNLVSAGGVFGGHREIAQGAVGRRASAAELEQQIAALDAQLRADGEQLSQLGGELKALVERRVELETELGRKRALVTELKAAERAGQARLSELGSTLDALEREHAALRAETERLEAEFDAARARVETASAEFERENAQLIALETERRAAEQRVEDCARDESRAQVEMTRLAGELAGKRDRTRELERVCEASQLELDRARRLAREHAQNADAAQAECGRVREDGDRLLVERGQTEQRHEELRRQERAGREAIDTYRQRVDAVTREIETLTNELGLRRLEAQRIELACHELAVRAQEDLNLSEFELLDGFEPQVELQLAGELDVLEARVAELKKKLDAIGPVNTEAVNELTEAAGRLEFLETQRTDLDQSRKSLIDALTHLNQESVRLFLETFADVRGHFQALFRQLFGGGKADLELQEGVDPLEAGIEISARPPGREMLPIGLLSGGQRTMTALALLFAVFRARPSPFCVLDEVDAALDDANVGRFLAMVDGFRHDTQFVVVTHNKGTMASCDRLYGITMETKGVSTYVSVEFSEVERFVPEATGNASEASKARAQTRSSAAAEVDSEPVVVLQPQGRGGPTAVAT
jgi:chromosome segregation protein